jgi:hypothetical protein
MLLATGSRRVDRDRIEFPVANSALRDHSFCKPQDLLGGSAKYHRLDAVVMVKMGMHRGYRNVVVVVLHAREPAGELTLMVVVHVTQGPDAILGGTLVQTLLSQCTSKQIAEGLGSVAVAFLFNQAVEGIGQCIIDRYSYSTHRMFSVVGASITLIQSGLGWLSVPALNRTTGHILDSPPRRLRLTTVACDANSTAALRDGSHD